MMEFNANAFVDAIPVELLEEVKELLEERIQDEQAIECERLELNLVNQIREIVRSGYSINFSTSAEYDEYETEITPKNVFELNVYVHPTEEK